MKKLLWWVLGLLLLGAGSLAAYVYHQLVTPVVPDPVPKPYIIVQRGMRLPQIADSLQRNGIIPDRNRFLLAARLIDREQPLKAGKYALTPGLSLRGLLRLLRSGKSMEERVTLPEGKTAEEFAAILARTLALDAQEFLQAVADSALARTLGLPVPSLEGYLYPDTYHFYWGVTAREVVAMLVREFQRHLDDTLRAQIAASGLSLHEIVTLASIIEGEAVLDSERALIAAVYHNRLRAGMRLQADPTIQYLLPGPPRRLLLRDLEIDSPYNTYLYAGLPPGPVNNPGIASLRAAARPAKAGYLYFVARGDGSHVFSYTLQQHLNAKADFDRVRARVRRERNKAQAAQERRAVP
ncbi:MAG: endolytic transglycosylase MltG [candidate division KSB1 bacterium]|nr:endolytic transglycosylase MltG [candidate division KSB1 bacterium]MDZ7275942.1 endolytic transglycosylase MltG [candidate division KSB1 bacterium]MDZ7285776.1 endolytic transglycosylase MltG [candidate division KSB1 bacterium]MDZ7298808.1 endolytic transglycosylase MltG [candidate division KSB1 bacterium]MDZ7308846.1 endolytic transglycosylase MltG [candidate division KSB1 bacterium]